MCSTGTDVTYTAVVADLGHLTCWLGATVDGQILSSGLADHWHKASEISTAAAC